MCLEETTLRRNSVAVNSGGSTISQTEGAPTPRFRVKTCYLAGLLPKNCMDMKEIGLRVKIIDHM